MSQDTTTMTPEDMVILIEELRRSNELLIHMNMKLIKEEHQKVMRSIEEMKQQNENNFKTLCRLIERIERRFASEDLPIGQPYTQSNPPLVLQNPPLNYSDSSVDLDSSSSESSSESFPSSGNGKKRRKIKPSAGNLEVPEARHCSMVATHSINNLLQQWFVDKEGMLSIVSKEKRFKMQWRRKPSVNKFFFRRKSIINFLETIVENAGNAESGYNEFVSMGLFDIGQSLERYRVEKGMSLVEIADLCRKPEQCLIPFRQFVCEEQARNRQQAASRESSTSE